MSTPTPLLNDVSLEQVYDQLCEDHYDLLAQLETMRDTTYNGHTNYETWCANLYLNNSEGTYRILTEAAEAAYADTDEDDDTDVRIEETAENLVPAVGDMIRVHLQEEDATPGDLLSHVITGFMQEVDTLSLAEPYAQAAAEEAA